MDVIKKIQQLKERSGPLLGCFPLYPPLELLHSMGINPVVLWGLRDSIYNLDESDIHLQNYTCSVARYLTEFVLSETGSLLDGLFLYNACDSLRNLPEILQGGMDNLDRDRLDIYKIHIPAVSAQQSPSSIEFLGNEITSLINILERSFNLTFSNEKFLESVRLYSEMRNLAMKIEKLVAAGQVSFCVFQNAVMDGYFLTIEDHIESLRSIAGGNNDRGGKKGPGKPVFLSGILPPLIAVCEAIEEAGLIIAGNDIAAMRRSYGYIPPETDDPVGYYKDFYSNHFPCSTILHMSDRRLKALEGIIGEYNSRGFIFIGEKFCEYEYLELPYLENMLKNRGLQTLKLEFSVDDRKNIEALKTRIEAFGEML